MKKFLILLGIAALVMGVFMMPRFSSADELATAKINISNNLEERGKQLRAAIDQEYKKVVGASGVSTAKLQSEEVGNEIAAVVIQYIPSGTSFADAEQILRSAGFKIKPRPGPNPPRDYDSKWDARRFDEVAALDPYIASTWFGPETSIFVNLSPQTPQDYTKVSRIYARITSTSL